MTSRRSGSHHLDLLDDPAKWQIPSGVDLAFIMAAQCKIADCETDPTAWRVNVERTILLAQMLRDRGAHLVFPSTTRVFDGAREAPGSIERPNPTCRYGQMKAEAEWALLTLGATVLRLGKVVALHTEPFLSWRVALLSGRQAVGYRATVAPVSIDVAVDALWQLGSGYHPGVFHLTASRETTYAAIVEAMRAEYGGEAVAIEAPPGFPKHAALDCRSLTRATGLTAPDPLAFIPMREAA